MSNLKYLYVTVSNIAFIKFKTKIPSNKKVLCHILEYFSFLVVVYKMYFLIERILDSVKSENKATPSV